MSTIHPRILAIDPGTRYMGLAVLENGRLLYRSVEIIPQGRTPEQTLGDARNAVLRYLTDFRPRILAVERAFFGSGQRVALLNTLVRELRALARRRGLQVLAYAPSTIKKQTCGYGWAGKREISWSVVSRFPELKVYLTQDRAWKERFHQNMFDAIALGLLASRELARGR